MILIDAGPLVALHNPGDLDHLRCVEALDHIEEPLLTTLPVLTEAFHLLSVSKAPHLMDFIERGGLHVSFSEMGNLSRSLALMMKYSDLPMDFADASLVATAEQHKLQKIFTLDARDFTTYRIKRGHRHVPFELIP